MAITDISISEELETGAPSIKYRGNEGPQAPQQKAEFDIQEYMIEFESVFPEMKNKRGTQEYMEMLKQYFEGLAKGPILPSPEDPVNPFGPKPQGPVLPNRQMAAYGGMMGNDGRRRYGLGSFLKKTVRKIIPNEVAKVAQVAAPFIAPFNPLAAAVAGGLGSFDQTGSITSGLKSGLMNYGLGQGARYLGGADFQTGFNPLGGFTEGTTGTGPLSRYFSKPTGEGGIKNLTEKIFSGKSEGPVNAENIIGSRTTDSSVREKGITNLGEIQETIQESTPTNLKKLTEKSGMNTKALLGILGLSAAAGAYTAATSVDDVLTDVERGSGLDSEIPSGILSIRTEVIEAMKDPSGKKLAALRTKYPFLGTQASKDVANMAYGGRINRAEGGLMDLGGLEKDYRAEGGFVPIGAKEKADDVPARLSVNEFVFTADAVRNAGGGDIDKGAEVMENMMKHLEQGGQVSQESQGMQGARDMFATSERLSEVVG
jgi:hypothetical protein